MTPELYKEIMREYSKRQAAAARLAESRRNEVYEKIPELEDIENRLLSFNLRLAAAFGTLDKNARRAEGEKVKAETAALLKEKIRLLEEKGYPADYMEDVYLCSLCHDTGFIENEQCSCFKTEIRKRLYTDSSMKSENDGESFDTFSLEYYSDEISPKLKTSYRKYMEGILKLCKGFAKEPKGNILFTGRTGVGKSFLCHAIAKELLSKNTDVVCDSAFIIFDRLLNYRFGRDEEPEYRDSIFNCSLLIIDDLGTENINSASSAEFFNLINYRLVNKKPVIISTNLSADEIKNTYTERISSRIMGGFRVIPIFGEDIRIIKKKKQAKAVE